MIVEDSGMRVIVQRWQKKTGEAVDIAFIFLVFVTIAHPFLVENDQFSSTNRHGAVQG